MFGSCFLGRACNGSFYERKRFLLAVEHGKDAEAVASLTHRPDLVTATTLFQRKTALHLAAEKGHAGVMASILETMLCQASLDVDKDGGAPSVDSHSLLASIINSRDANGRTALIIACGHNHVECARLLLTNGGWRSPVDDRGNSALHYASAKGYLGILLLLLTEYPDELKMEQLQILTQQQQQQQSAHSTTTVPTLDASQLPDFSRLTNTRNIAGFSPLHYAVWGKQSGSVQVLLQHGSELVARNERAGVEASIPCPSHSTPLHLAAMRGHIEISRIILKTFYECVMEPMQLQAARPGQDADDLTRRLTEVDPRRQVNSMGLMPYKVAQRMGFLGLATMLRPNIPLARLFNEEEHRTRFYGPPALKLLAAEALNKKLVNAIAAAVAYTPPPGSTFPSLSSFNNQGPAHTVSAPMLIMSVPAQTNGPSSASSGSPGLLSPSAAAAAGMRLAHSTPAPMQQPDMNQPLQGLPTVKEAEEENASSQGGASAGGAKPPLSPTSPTPAGHSQTNASAPTPGAGTSGRSSASIMQSPFAVAAGATPVPAAATPPPAAPDTTASQGLLASNSDPNLLAYQDIAGSGKERSQPSRLSRFYTTLGMSPGLGTTSTSCPGAAPSPAPPQVRLSQAGASNGWPHHSLSQLAGSSGTPTAGTEFRAASMPRNYSTGGFTSLAQGLEPSRSLSPPPGAARHQTMSGVLVLHRGNSITLINSTPSHQQPQAAPPMAALTVLDHLSTLVEDTAAELPRQRMASCLPNMTGVASQGMVDEEDEECMDVPNPTAHAGAAGGVGGTGHGGARVSPALSSRPSFDNAVTAVNAPSSRGLSRQSASNTVQATVRAVARSLSGLRRSMSGHSNAFVAASTSGAAAGTASAGLEAAASTPVELAALRLNRDTGEYPTQEGTASQPISPYAASSATGGDTGCLANTPVGMPPTPAGLPTMYPDLEFDEDDDECGVCLEHPPQALVLPCMHAICGPCAKKMCSLNAQRTPICPFCRATIADFAPNKALALKLSYKNSMAVSNSVEAA